MKKYTIFLLFFLFSKLCATEDFYLENDQTFYINEQESRHDLSEEEFHNIRRLQSSIVNDEFLSPRNLIINSEIKSIRNEGAQMVSNDGHLWNIGTWYKNTVKTWKSGQRLKISYHSSIFYFNNYEIENLDTDTKAWASKASEETKFNYETTLYLEEHLNQKVLAQKEASAALATAILNYSSGLKDPATPIGVFLFLGPTGVGKTEMAKVLAEELYQKPEAFIRFDMSHFTHPSDITRLIGAPPGYVNHEEGGQLTEALKKTPRSVVLLDEIEKADQGIRKAFLPVFDDGYITDSKNKKIKVNDVVFIMTSNLCSIDIMTLFKQGFSSEEILDILEPALTEILSPELYARVHPIVFKPLEFETMKQMVDIMLKKVVQRIKKLKNIDVTIGEEARSYLMIHGYHPTSGARPLKKLIEKEITGRLSHAVVTDHIPSGSTVVIDFLPSDKTWHINWH